MGTPSPFTVSKMATPVNEVRRLIDKKMARRIKAFPSARKMSVEVNSGQICVKAEWAEIAVFRFHTGSENVPPYAIFECFRQILCNGEVCDFARHHGLDSPFQVHRDLVPFSVTIHRVEMEEGGKVVPPF